MALEINEINIQMRVGERSDEVKQNQPDIQTTECGNPDYEAIVADCTRRVLQRIAIMQER